MSFWQYDADVSLIYFLAIFAKSRTNLKEKEGISSAFSCSKCYLCITLHFYFAYRWCLDKKQIPAVRPV